MVRFQFSWMLIVLLFLNVGMGCAAQPTSGTDASPTAASGVAIKVVAAETFLADIAQNVAGTRTKVEPLMPLGSDPHEFEPNPTDVARIASADLVIISGAGFEESLEKILAQNSNKRAVVEASAGLTVRDAHKGEMTETVDAEEHHAHHELDPHFWLDPNNVTKYVENIRDALTQADPVGSPIYAANAEVYIVKLKDLDRWISEQVAQVQPSKRSLVTNHESLGYFADRYGFKIVGTIIPAVSTEASPSAQQVARLVDQIRSTGTKAIFLETGTNPQMAQQIAQETGIKVFTQLYTHSITDSAGPAPSYIDMMKCNVNLIVEALK